MLICCWLVILRLGRKKDVLGALLCMLLTSIYFEPMWRGAEVEGGGGEWCLRDVPRNCAETIDLESHPPANQGGRRTTL